MSCRDTTHVTNNNFVTIWLQFSSRKRFPSVQFCSGRDGLKEEEISVAQGIHSHSLTLFAPSWVEHEASQQQVPSITILRFLLNPIPAWPSQIFPFGFSGSPPSDLWSARPSLVFRGPGERNSAVVHLHYLTVFKVSEMRPYLGSRLETVYGQNMPRILLNFDGGRLGAPCLLM